MDYVENGSFFCDNLVVSNKQVYFAVEKWSSDQKYFIKYEIKRDIHLKRLIASMHNGLIKVVTGIRRSGKSYLLRELFKNYLIEDGVKDNHIIELDFENRRNNKYRDLDALIEYIDSRMVNDDMYYILLDEIQLVSEFEDVLNSYLSIKNSDVYVTGSNGGKT